MSKIEISPDMLPHLLRGTHDAMRGRLVELYGPSSRRLVDLKLLGLCRQYLIIFNSLLGKDLRPEGELELDKEDDYEITLNETEKDALIELFLEEPDEPFAKLIKKAMGVGLAQESVAAQDGGGKYKLARELRKNKE